MADAPPILKKPETIDDYQALYDALGRAYWEASDIQSKDVIQGARESIYDIISDLDEAQLEANTSLLLAVEPKIKQTCATLKKIQSNIDDITKNIATAAKVVDAINKVLSIAAAL
jgi:hypothetical protein